MQAEFLGDVDRAIVLEVMFEQTTSRRIATVETVLRIGEAAWGRVAFEASIGAAVSQLEGRIAFSECGAAQFRRGDIPQQG